MEFQEFKKIPRLSRDCVITEKIDGTNAQIYIVQKENIITDLSGIYAGYGDLKLWENKEFMMFSGSRKRWLDCSSDGDNFGFAKWVQVNAEELLKLGEGRHYGEWYGKGIQRGYGLNEKRFALFNVHKWGDPEVRPKCCGLVPVLYEGMFNTISIDTILLRLKMEGSSAVPGFDKPEGIVIYHKASGQLFKKTIEKDEKPKGQK